MSSNFFPSTIYGRGDGSFTPLFRLLEDFDSYSRGNGTPHGRHQQQRGANLPTFHPRFDVRELETGYELHGELPGLDKKDIHIEFSDPQTMIVRGRVERHYSSGTPPVAGLLDHSTDHKAIEGGRSGEKESHQPTVEDDDEDAEGEKAGTQVVHKSGNVAVAKKQQNQHQDGAKYWVSERSIGEFSRTFHFQTLVDQDAVRASLNNGVLAIEIPKARKVEGRRINVD